MHDACANGHYDVVEYLLAHGGNADTVADLQPTEHWSTPALMACSTADLEPHYGGSDSEKLGNMMELLCRHGANVNQQVPETGATCLHYTASQGNLDATKRLVAFGADILGPKHQGRASALRLAIEYDRAEIVAFLRVAAKWLKDSGKSKELYATPSRKKSGERKQPGTFAKSSALLEIAAAVGCPSAILHHLETDAADPHFLAAHNCGQNAPKHHFELPSQLMHALVGDGSMHSFPEEAMREKREELTTNPGYTAAMALLRRATRPWSWTNHSLFHSGVRRVVSTVMLVSHRHWHSELPPAGLPHMPVEMWHHILSFVTRSEHCSANGPAASGLARGHYWVGDLDALDAQLSDSDEDEDDLDSDSSYSDESDDSEDEDDF